MEGYKKKEKKSKKTDFRENETIVKELLLRKETPKKKSWKGKKRYEVEYEMWFVENEGTSNAASPLILLH